MIKEIHYSLFKELLYLYQRYNHRVGAVTLSLLGAHTNTLEANTCNNKRESFLTNGGPHRLRIVYYQWITKVKGYLNRVF